MPTCPRGATGRTPPSSPGRGALMIRSLRLSMLTIGHPHTYAIRPMVLAYSGCMTMPGAGIVRAGRSPCCGEALKTGAVPVANNKPKEATTANLCFILALLEGATPESRTPHCHGGHIKPSQPLLPAGACQVHANFGKNSTVADRQLMQLHCIESFDSAVVQAALTGFARPFRRKVGACGMRMWTR